MRSFVQFVLIGTLAAILLPRVSAPAAQAQSPARDAATVLAEAREALGGEKRLSAVKNFVVTGRTRQVRGDNLVPIEFEIAVELPDKYVRKDEIPAQESGPTSTGFNGDELIQLPVPATPTGPPGMPPGTGRAGPATPPSPAQLDAARKTRVATVKQDFVRLTLGMFAGSFSSYPLTFTYVGQAEAPQGKADVIDAKAPNFTVRLFVNSQTHLPIMVSWQAPGRPAGPPRGSAPPSLPPGASVGQGLHHVLARTTSGGSRKSIAGVNQAAAGPMRPVATSAEGSTVAIRWSTGMNPIMTIERRTCVDTSKASGRVKDSPAARRSADNTSGIAILHVFCCSTRPTPHPQVERRQESSIRVLLSAELR